MRGSERFSPQAELNTPDLYPGVPNFKAEELGFKSQVLTVGINALRGGQIEEGLQQVCQLIEQRGGRVIWRQAGEIQRREPGNVAKYSRGQRRVIEIEEQEPVHALYQLLHEYVWGLRYWLRQFPGQGQNYQRLKRAVTLENCAKADIAIAAALPATAQRQARLNLAKLHYLRIRSGEIQE